MAFTLSPRLAAAASLVRPSATLCDVGTDHALLPIFLISEGIALKAVVTDIAAGPITRAKENISKYGFNSRITALQADGLTGVECYYPTDVTICGMGGENIRDIIIRAPWVRSRSVRLICQPQSFAPMLREFLLSSGFDIKDEQLCLDRGKYYVAIAAEFDGEVRAYSPAELFLGRKNIEHGGDLFRDFRDSRISTLEKKRDGMKIAGADTSYEDELIRELSNI